MSYKALLFCPDEKTARTVTQVLSDLEFTVEPCNEPFFAVKKLMAEHFDAVVVDCDNEQNAALLFKSARNSSSNHSSLAVAVVEGQAGVAKAFRLGANLVLTKPINVEQAKGTVRVARGLLRKSEPAKPTAPAAKASAPASTAGPEAVPAPPKPAAPLDPSMPRAVVPVPAPKPASSSASLPSRTASPAVASSTPAAHDHNEDLLEINLAGDDAESALTPSAPPATQPLAKPAVSFAKPHPAAAGSGSASAPAPARKWHDSSDDEPLFDVPAEPKVAEAPEALSEKTRELATQESASIPSPDPAPEFTFGGNVGKPEPSQGGSKKTMLVLVALVLLAAALYIGWTQLHGKVNLPFLGANEPAAAPVASSPSPRPATPVNPPAPTSTPAAVPAVQSSAQPASAAPAQPASSTADFAATQEDSVASTSGPSSARLSKSSATPTARSTAAKASQPIIVKGDAPLPTLKKADAPVDPAPSMVGMGTAGSGAPINLVNTAGHATRPVLQSVNVSQGVSQGVVIKKVQPKYPSNAISRHIEGSVSLMATIGKSGSITAVKVVSGEPMLTQAAIDAVRQWKYKPYLLNGEPVELQTEVTLVFKLPR